MMNLLRTLRRNYKNFRFSPAKPQIVKGRFDLYYNCIPNSALDYHILKNGILPDWIATQEVMELQPDSVIFDIGANVGHLSLVFAKKYASKGHVYAFEPDFENFAQLQRNCELNNSLNITPMNIALQNDFQIKKMSLRIRRSIDGDGNQNRGLSSLIETKIHTVDDYFVKTSTLDVEISRNSLQRLDLIKIDVEGAEHLVILGGLSSIEKYKPIIQYEYSNKLDQLLKIKNTEAVFREIHKLGYVQFILKDERELIMLTEANSELPDVNVICFHHTKIPRFISYL